MMSDFEIIKLYQMFIFIWFRLSLVLILDNKLENTSIVGEGWVVVILLLGKKCE